MKKILFILCAIVCLTSCKGRYEYDSLNNFKGGVIVDKLIDRGNGDYFLVIEAVHPITDRYVIDHFHVSKYTYDRYHVGDTIK